MSDPAFPVTHWSVIARAGHDDSVVARKAIAELCEMYWRPVYAFVRRRGFDPHDAEDLTQAFLGELIEKDYAVAARQEKGKFRTFLLMAVKRFLGHERERRQTRKRGGHCRFVPIDTEATEARLRLEAPERLEPDALFDRQWAVTLLERVMRKLDDEYRETGRAELFENLRDCMVKDAAALPYADIARHLCLSEPAVKMAVSRLRARYREILRAEIAETVESPGDIDDEIRYLFALFAK